MYNTEIHNMYGRCMYPDRFSAIFETRLTNHKSVHLAKLSGIKRILQKYKLLIRQSRLKNGEKFI